jgi:inhibitor of growth protein 3
MQMGRRTASLKASYEAINSGLNPNLYSFNPLRDHSPNSSMNRSDIFGYDSSLKSGSRNNKRARTSQYGSDTSSNSHITVNNVFEDNSSEGLEGNGPPDWTYDPNEPRYCICNNVSYGEMIACDNEDVSK